jgi:8-oxo-dGTP diphosphatase
MGNWEKRHRLVVAVFLIFIKDGKILLLERANTGYKDGWYSLPAGHVDGNEPAIAAARREAKEEVGVDILLKDLRLVHTMHELAEGHERINLGFEVLNYKGKLQNMEPHKCAGLRWVHLTGLPDKTVDQVKLFISMHAKREPYSSFNFE